MATPFLSKPYSERQLIVVSADEVVEAEEKARAESSTNNYVDWAKVASITARILVGHLVPVCSEIALEAIKAWNRARESGVAVLAIGRSDASHLQLPPGHPRDGVLYVGHPAVPSLYYTPSSFHRFCFEHKFCEAIELLMHLGATLIYVEHVSGWSKEFSSNLSMPLGTTDVGVKACSKATTDSQLLYKATFSGTSKPNVPEGLVWYPHEPTWQKVAQGRLKFGLKNFSLSVRYEDDFGINAGLKASVSKAGLDFGGKFEDHQSTVWRIDGEFAPTKGKR